MLVSRAPHLAALLLALNACRSEDRVVAGPDADAGVEAGAPCASAHGDAGAPAAHAHDVLTQHNDNARTGATLSEVELDTCSVAGLTELGQYPVDGEIYAQPLYVADVATPRGPKNLLLIATMSDSLYAFDADAPGSEPVWQLGSQRELGAPAFSARNVGGNNGILATPVIDRDAGKLFLVSRDCAVTSPAATPRCQQRLFAIELATGKILQDVGVAGSVPAPDGSFAFFDPSLHWARAGLLLRSGQVYIAFGSGPNGNAHEEDFEFHGWLFRYAESDLTRLPSVYCSTPSFGGGAIWQSGNGPAADDDALFVATGNGIHQPTPLAPAGFPALPAAGEDSVLRFPGGTDLSPAGQFWDLRPYHDDGNVFQYMEKNDIDLGTAGPMLIPDSGYLIAAGKSGILYVLDRGGLFATQDPLEVFHSPPLAAGQSKYIYSYDGGPHVHGSPAFFRPEPALGALPYGFIYYWPAHEPLTSFSFNYRTGEVKEALRADVPGTESGGTLSVSADGARPESAIVWASTVDPDDGAGHLWALSATTLARLWDAKLPAWAKFALPTVAAGRVYLASSSNAPGAEPRILVFGLAR